MKMISFLFLIGGSFCAMAQTNYNQSTISVSPDDGSTSVTVIGNLVGICAVVRKEKESGKILIVETLKQGASDKAGIVANDEIIQIDSTRVDGMGLDAIVPLLRGDPGTIVKLTIRRDGEANPLSIDVIRELVIIPKAE